MFCFFQDLYYGYHQINLIVWSLTVLLLNSFFWLVVLAKYQELSDITRLEDTIVASRILRGSSTTGFSGFNRSTSYASLYGSKGFDAADGGGGGGSGKLQNSFEQMSGTALQGKSSLHQSFLELFRERNASRRDLSSSKEIGLSSSSNNCLESHQQQSLTSSTEESHV